MSLKILGGKAKGFTISVPPADTIRPMQVMLKRRVFDSYQNLEGVTFVDLCAGSGAVGLEAWSRGADEIYYSEKVYQVCFQTSGNLKSHTTRRGFALNQLRLPASLHLKLCYTH